jgi:hypothetical protein
MLVLRHPPLVLKADVLQLLCIARISAEHEDGISIDAQEASTRRLLDRRWGGRYELTRISGRGSGEAVPYSGAVQE